MSQFNYLNELTSALTMDGDLSNRCPAPRWQKKAGDMSASSSSMLNSSSLNTSKLSMSHNNNGYLALATSMTAGKTPQKNGGTGTNNKTKKSPGGKTKAPPLATGGDRFIPHRGSTNFEIGHYLVKQEQHKQQSSENNGNAASSSSSSTNIQNNLTDHQMLVGEALQVGDINSRRLFSYQEKAPAAPDFHQNPLRVVYSVTKTPLASAKGHTRHVPESPDRILDAPNLINDYYLNLMDWSHHNIITVALGNKVFLWNAISGDIQQLRSFDEAEHATSLSWIQQGHILAIGTIQGTVELWDCEQKKRLRVMEGHESRVGTLAWNSFTVTSGSRDTNIIHHDVRQREHAVSTLSGHTLEVCGLRWSSDYKYLASGGNDNVVNVWTGVGASGSGQQQQQAEQPLHAFTQHQAAVRALDWCPWQPNVLASGGGTADRCIKFWNVNNGKMINSVDTQSQVCALLWSRTYKELISAHGYANNQLTIWKYPSLTKQTELMGHTARVLQLAMSPDGSMVMSAAADETLRLWHCFLPDQTKKKAVGGMASKPSVLKQSIR